MKLWINETGTFLFVFKPTNLNNIPKCVSNMYFDMCNIINLFVKMSY